jgi:phage terminase large subunit-like protein
VPVRSPFIKTVATEEGQAGNTYGAVEVMLREGRAARTPGLDIGRTRTFLPGGGEIRAVSSASASKDGGKETFVNFDETHLYRGPELVGVHATLRRNLAKRRAAEPWSLETTTMYAPGEESVAETAHVYASKIARGEIIDPGFLFDHLEGPPVVDFFDDEQILASLRVAYGEAAEWMDFDRLLADAAEARESVDHKRMVADFRRYFLNQPTRAEEAVWIPPSTWLGLAAEDAPAVPPDGARVGVGVEVDITGTLAAVGMVWADGDRTVVAATVWTCRRGVPAHHTQDGDALDLGPRHRAGEGVCDLGGDEVLVRLVRVRDRDVDRLRAERVPGERRRERVVPRRQVFEGERPTRARNHRVVVVTGEGDGHALDGAAGL